MTGIRRKKARLRPACNLHAGCSRLQARPGCATNGRPGCARPGCTTKGTGVRRDRDARLRGLGSAKLGCATKGRPGCATNGVRFLGGHRPAPLWALACSQDQNDRFARGRWRFGENHRVKTSERTVHLRGLAEDEEDGGSEGAKEDRPVATAAPWCASGPPRSLSESDRARRPPPGPPPWPGSLHPIPSGD